MKIGIIADTHIPDLSDALPERIAEAFRGLDIILHAGDVCDLAVLQEFQETYTLTFAVHGEGDSEAVRAYLDEKRVVRFQKHLLRQELLIVDELGFVPLSKTGAEMLFEVFSQRYERGSALATSNLPFAEWTEVLGSERLTGALLDRLTHHVHILEMNGESFRLKTSKQKRTAERGR